MNKEIKEILDLLNFNRDTISNGTCRVEDFASREQIIKLLDYITNLQQENERLNTIIDELEKYLEEEKDERYSWHYREWIRQVQDKLKELKGSDKK